MGGVTSAKGVAGEVESALAAAPKPPAAKAEKASRTQRYAQLDPLALSRQTPGCLDSVWVCMCVLRSSLNMEPQHVNRDLYGARSFIRAVPK